MAYAGQRGDWKFHLQSLPGEQSSFSSTKFCLLCGATRTASVEPARDLNSYVFQFLFMIPRSSPCKAARVSFMFCQALVLMSLHMPSMEVLFDA